MAHKCNYAPPGTYGHECGTPATLYADTPRTEADYQEWGFGLFSRAQWDSLGPYRHYRCATCAKAKGPDNKGITKWTEV